MFKYHTLEDEAQLRFYQMPKVLFHSDAYKGLSLGAKSMYSVLRDRQELSRKNNWYDEKGRLYLIFTVKNLCELLDISDRTVTSYKRELIKYKLLKETRQGQGKPNLLYVGAPDYTESDTRKENYPQGQTIANNESRNMYDSRNEDTTSLEAKEVRPNDTEFIETDVIDNQSINQPVNQIEEKKDRLKDKDIMTLLSEKYDSDIITLAMQKANKAKESGTTIINLYSYLDKICKATKEEQELLDSAPASYRRTGFHVAEQRTDNYTAEELEEIFKEKRRSYSERLKANQE